MDIDRKHADSADFYWLDTGYVETGLQPLSAIRLFINSKASMMAIMDVVDG